MIRQIFKTHIKINPIYPNQYQQNILYQNYQIFLYNQKLIPQKYQKLNFQNQFNFSNSISGPPPDIETKVKALEQNQPFFDRLIYFDPEVMATVPYPFQFVDPVVEQIKDLLVQINESLGLPWIGIISLTCLAARTTILPLIYLQIQRANRLTAIAPVLIQFKKLIDSSQMNKIDKFYYLLRGSFQIIRKQNLKMFRLFVYNIFHFPIMITMIFSMRRLLIQDSVKNTSFLWIDSLSAPDPYYIVPFVTIGCYYYNLQRFITPENKHTFISKLRNVGQILMILWLPLLSNWPSAIQWYMLSNAIISIIQTTIIIQPQFLRYIEPKMLLYQYMLRIVEFDKTQSETLVESIKNGEESLKDKAISEELLVAQTEDMLKKLNAEIYDDLEHYTSNVQQQEPTNQQQDKIIYNQELKF